MPFRCQTPQVSLFPQKHLLKTQFVLIFFDFFSWHILALTNASDSSDKQGARAHPCSGQKHVRVFSGRVSLHRLWVRGGIRSQLRTTDGSNLRSHVRGLWRSCFLIISISSFEITMKKEYTRASLQSSPWIFLLINHFCGCSPVTLPRWPRHKSVAAKATPLQV